VMTGLSVLNLGIIVICAVIALTLVVGRIFCGTICPVGSLQELAYIIPVKKIIIRCTGIPERVRLFVFAATAVAALYLIDILSFTCLYDLFSLTLIRHSCGSRHHRAVNVCLPPGLPVYLPLWGPLLPVC
jgi:polyferredoxin